MIGGSCRFFLPVNTEVIERAQHSRSHPGKDNGPCKGSKNKNSLSLKEGRKTKYQGKNQKKLKPKVYEVPRDIDKWVAKLKLESMGISIDMLTPEQEKYLASWEMGT